MSVVGECALLQTEVSGRSGETSCLGENVTYICSISGFTHVWRISGFSDAAFVTAGQRSDNIGPYSIEAISVSGVNMVTESRLTVTSFPGLNGVNITCLDTTATNGEVQETTAMVFGKNYHCPFPVIFSKYAERVCTICITASF